MSNVATDIDAPISAAPKAATYPVGAVVEFAITGFRINTIKGGQTVVLNLRPDTIVEWPEGEEEVEVALLPIMRKTEFLMENDPAARTKLSDKLAAFTGVEYDDTMTTREHLNAMRGHALSLAVIDGPNERGDYKTNYRHNV